MFNCIICDDNKEEATLVYEMLNDIYNDQLNCTLKYSEKDFNNKELTICNILIIDIDLVFSNGDNSTGIEIAKQIKIKHPDVQVVFVSAFHEYAQDIFEVSPIYYVQKPVHKEVLKVAVDKAIDRIMQIKNDFFSFNIGSEIYKIRMCDIIYFESEKRLVKLVAKDYQYSFYSRIKDVEEKLDDRFIKCHQSFIVNMEHITRFSGNNAVMNTGVNVPISQSRYSDVKKTFTKFLGDTIA